MYRQKATLPSYKATCHVDTATDRTEKWKADRFPELHIFIPPTSFGPSEALPRSVSRVAADVHLTLLSVSLIYHARQVCIWQSLVSLTT